MAGNVDTPPLHALCFDVAVEDRLRAFSTPPQGLAGNVAEARRTYTSVVTLQRVHQVLFRQRVLRAYQDRCAVCRLRHVELLDAAHILPDGHPLGEPIVPNGISLCNLHHAAFDRHIMGVRPDLVIEIREDILHETDGPMLRFGLQEIAGTSLVVPRSQALRPKEAFLEERYGMFRKAG